VTFENVADNLRESFRVVAAGREGGEVRELPGVSIAAACVTFQMFNAAFLSSPVLTEADLQRRILLSGSHFNVRGLEWACWACEDWMEPRTRRRSRQIFQRLGLRHSVDLPGMAADRIAQPAKPLPLLDVRRVTGGSVQEAFCSIGSTCFHVPIPWFREVFQGGRVWDKFAAYVGYHNREPVSTAATVLGGDAIGVYNVATIPDRQHQGFGEAVMRHALAEAQRTSGIERTILQSTPAGYRLYQRMGYRQVTRIAVYAS